MRMLRSIVVTNLVSSFVLCGCSTERVAKVAAFQPREDESIVQRAPRTGTYSLRFTADKKRIDAPKYAAADRFAIKGDLIGFTMEEDGSTSALFRDERIPIEAMPAGATHMMWYHKSKQPTQFSREMRKAGDAAGEVTAHVLRGAFMVGAAVVVLREGDGSCP